WLTGNDLQANLSARSTSDQYNGILMYQDAADTLSDQFGSSGGGSAAKFTVNGALYFPTATNVSFGSAPDSNESCSLLVGYHITLAHSGHLYNNCSTFGGSPLHTAALVE